MLDNFYTNFYQDLSPAHVIRATPVLVSAAVTLMNAKIVHVTQTPHVIIPQEDFIAHVTLASPVTARHV